MGIERDIPSELKPFWKIFDKWCYRWDYATVFDDFLTMCIPNFSLSQRYVDERDRIKEKYNEKEIQYFRECFSEMVRVYQDQFQTNSWYDFFGELYQAITSGYKSQKMGQFFTPAPVCDMIAKSVIGDNVTSGQTVNDPACGSSRMLLAAHGMSIYEGKKLYLIAQDVDPMCCKMSVLNFIFHGCEGEILCMNTITMDYRFGYKVKSIPGIAIPMVTPLSLEHSSLFERKTETTLRLIKTENKETPVEVEYVQGELFVA